MKKLMKGMLAVGMSCLLVGCGQGASEEAATPISVISREDGSGTRGAFTELFGLEKDDVDQTLETAEITNSTSVMISTVQGDANAIGYISLGSLSDDVQALKIDGVEASAENVKSGDYKVSRPFNVCVKEDAKNELADDFMSYILSKDGQAIVEEEGYIATDTEETYTTKNLSGSLTVGGSSSVTPLMEKLAEAYQKVNEGVEISVQQSDSTTGATNTIDGVYDIGMCSRELKDEEKEKGLKPIVIATDGIAVIVNKDNAVKELTSDQVNQIYTGAITDWSEIQ